MNRHRKFTRSGDMKAETKMLAFKVLPEEHQAFKELCDSKEVSISVMLYKIMRDFVKKEKTKTL